MDQACDSEEVVTPLMHLVPAPAVRPRELAGAGTVMADLLSLTFPWPHRGCTSAWRLERIRKGNLWTMERLVRSSLSCFLGTVPS